MLLTFFTNLVRGKKNNVLNRHFEAKVYTITTVYNVLIVDVSVYNNICLFFLFLLLLFFFFGRGGGKGGILKGGRLSPAML